MNIKQTKTKLNPTRCVEGVHESWGLGYVPNTNVAISGSSNSNFFSRRYGNANNNLNCAIIVLHIIYSSHYARNYLTRRVFEVVTRVITQSLYHLIDGSTLFWVLYCLRGDVF